MRSFSVLAVLSAVLSAGAASACCFFKCFHAAPPPPAAAPSPGAQRAASPVPLTTSAAYVTITSVGGQAPDSTNHIPNPVNPSPYVEVVAETDYNTGLSQDPLLSLTELVAPPPGPGPGPGPAVAKAARKKPTVKLKSKRRKVRPKTADLAPLPTTDDTTTPWEFIYDIYGLDYGASYSTSASISTTSGPLSSPTVYFQTQAAMPPAGPPGGEKKNK